MGNKAKTIEEQISLLRSRGMAINDQEKAEEVLLDVGYYRLGFYWFPFEQSYPEKKNRTHLFKEGTNFDDAVQLYYFDFYLRNILLRYLSRIEINFRTYLSYVVSNSNKKSPTWFVDPTVVNKAYISSFDKYIYTENFKRNKAIAHHHKMHINDKYAPAWKTLEFMTLGSTIRLFASLNEDKLKEQIASHYKINRVPVFENYINIILDIRNACAHGNILYDFSPIKSIRKGPAMMKNVNLNQNLNGALSIIMYLIRQISENRYNDLKEEIYNLIIKYKHSLVVMDILKNISGLDAEYYK